MGDPADLNYGHRQQILWQVLWLACSLIAPAVWMMLLRLAFSHAFPQNERVE